MVNWCLRILIVCIISVIIASFGISLSPEYFNTMFNVIGIMFSIAFSQILSFSFSNVTNDDFVKQHRNQLTRIRNTFIILFAFASLCFILSSKITNEYKVKVFKFSFNAFFGTYNIFCLIYFIINFIGLSNLKNKIDDLIRKS